MVALLSVRKYEEIWYKSFLQLFQLICLAFRISV